MANLDEMSNEELIVAFDKKVKKAVFRGYEPVKKGERPAFVQLGGQLAAGKSSAIKGIAGRYGPNVVVLSPDELRKHHKNYKKIMRDRPHDMVELTTPAMKAWTEMVCEHAHKEGYNLVLEGAFKTPDKLVKRAAKMSSPAYREEEGKPRVKVHDGCVNEVVAIATPRERSCLDMVNRYTKEPPGKGRWAEVEGHDKSFDQIPHSIAALEGSPAVNRVIVTDRSGTIHYDNTRGTDKEWSRPPQGAEVLKKARHEGKNPFDRAEARAWMDLYWKNCEQLTKRGEMNATTAPTMLALHEHADRVAQVAYTENSPESTANKRYQKIQKQVILAGARGVPNSELPPHPLTALQASKEEQDRYKEIFGENKRTKNVTPGKDKESSARARSLKGLAGQKGSAESNPSKGDDRER